MRYFITLSAVLYACLLFADEQASYVRLTNNQNDRAWVMFGVNEFSSGIPSITASDGTFSLGYSEVADTYNDNLATEGFPDQNGIDLGSIQALGDAQFTANPIVALYSVDLTYSPTEAVRSMYIAVEGYNSDAPVIKLNYKASLEGRNVELKINGGTKIYYTKINYKNTYSNPAVATAQKPSSTYTPLTNIEDTIIYDLGKAPVLAQAYDKSKHQGSNGGSLHRFYHYDAATEAWEIWENGNGANDFSAFEKGKAYWGRFDYAATQNTVNSGGNIGGLILGKNLTSEANASIYQNIVTSDMWNMLALDPAKSPDIRNASTGLLLAFDSAAANNEITIIDKTGINSVRVTLPSNKANEIADRINVTIEEEKYFGNITDSFNLKAFNVDDTNIIILSDAKFTIQDIDGSIGAASTLAAQRPIDPTTGKEFTADVSDVSATGVTSRYGEYMLIIQPMVGEGTASNRDYEIGEGADKKLSARLKFGTIYDYEDKEPIGLIDIAANTPTSLDSAIAQIELDDVFDDDADDGHVNGYLSKGKAHKIDIDTNGTADHLLVAATKPFYIKDNTYTRTYKYTAYGADGRITIIGDNKQNINIAANTSVEDLNASINALADVADASNPTHVYAATSVTSDGSDAIILFSGYKRNFTIYDSDTNGSIDYLIPVLIDNNSTKGAIGEVLNITKLARSSVNAHKYEVKIIREPKTDDNDGAGDDTFDIDTSKAGTISTSDINITLPPGDSDSDRLSFIDTVIEKINTVLYANAISAFAYHNYKGTGGLENSSIFIEGYGILAVTVTENGNTDSGGGAIDVFGNAASISTNPGKIGTAASRLIDDLKDNAVYTPDFVNNGPLYTLKRAGYEAKAIVRPTTKFAATPTTHWDHIDLTKPPATWLEENQFNLFSVDNTSGYWIYLTTADTTPTLSLENATVKVTYAYHFLDSGESINKIVAGILDVGIVRDVDVTANVYATIGGKDVELIRDGVDDQRFYCNIGSFETSLIAGKINDFILTMTNGIGDTTQIHIPFDYAKPNKPNISFSDALSVTIDSNSTDVARYALRKEALLDYEDAELKYLTPIEAQSYKLCHQSAYGSSTTFYAVALDGNGTFKGSNISDAAIFYYENTNRKATVLTHSISATKSAVMTYDDNCEGASPNRANMDVEAINGAVRMSFQPLFESNNDIDIPWTVYYKFSPSVSGADIKVSMHPTYAGKTVYFEYNAKLYKVQLPTTEVDADNSIGTPIDISGNITGSTNKTLQ